MRTCRYCNVSQLLQKRLASTRLLSRTCGTSLSQKPTTVLPAGSNQTKCRPNPSFARHSQRLCTSNTVNAHDEPTIFALSTAPGKSAIAIIRISGPACLKIYQSLCPGQPIPKPRYATLRTLYHPRSAAEVLDTGALVLSFLAPYTATGEDILELHVHGGNAVVKGLLSVIPLAAGSDNHRSEALNIRYAEPGEFTRRAFYNNRLDLTQVEALGDILAAETEQQRRIAVKGSSNVLARQYESWRQQLLDARGELEALIDFSEDQHFDESPSRLIGSVTEQIIDLKAKLQASIENASRGELLRNGIAIALVGAPNAGKSSLLNYIVGREAAIVSNEAGTTRDVIDVGVDLEGFYCKFADLAGLRETFPNQEVMIGSIEQEGMRRARERALIADVVVAVLAINPPCNNEGSGESTINVDPEVAATLRLCDTEKQAVVYVINKIDVLKPNEHMQTLRGLLEKKISDGDLPPSPLPISAISCMTDQHTRRSSDGVDSAAWESSLGATERQRLLLEQCSNDLQRFLDQAHQHPIDERLETESVDIVLAAESLRSAANALARMTGAGEAANVEEVLGVVFEKFLHPFTDLSPSP
ncbi:mitochondrial Homoaconitase [Xanthoria parietina]